MRHALSLGVLAALAATSSATITFGSLGTFGMDNGGGHAVISDSDLNGPSGMAPGMYTNTFTVTSTSTLIQASVHVPTSGIYDGDLSLSYVVDGTTTIYNDSVSVGTNPGGNESDLLHDSGFITLSLTPNVAHTVTYMVSYAANSGDSFAYIDAVDVYFKEDGSTPPPPVPEPSALAALGLGAAGLMARRKKVGK